MSLIEYSSSKALIEHLRDQKINEKIIDSASDIDTVAYVLGIDPNYLSVQVRLLIPYYSSEEIESQPSIILIRRILQQLRESLKEYEFHYNLHCKENGIRSLPSSSKLVINNNQLNISADQELVAVNFNDISFNIGFEIQEQLHYIHKKREDTTFHLGLSLNENKYPICYCSLSPCDRNYLVNSLSEVLGHDLDLNKVYVMARAFGFTPLPKNMMSKMFDLVADKIADCTDAEYIITALNPFLGFKGSIFLGSSYIPFATSPMIYNYSEDGLYLNRRNTHITKFVKQKYITPPILWFARAVKGGKMQKILENQKNYYEISIDEYNMR